MHKCVVCVVFLFGAVCCNLKESRHSEGQLNNWSQFVGTWCNATSGDTDNNLLRLTITDSTAILMEMKDIDDGTLVIEMNGRLLAEAKVELFLTNTTERRTHLESHGHFQQNAHSNSTFKIAKCFIEMPEKMAFTMLDNIGGIPAGKSFVLHKMVSEEDCPPPASHNDSEDDPFSRLVATYTSEEQKKLLGKAEPSSIQDLFLLLPKSDCYNISVSGRKTVLRGQTYKSPDRLLMVSMAGYDARFPYLQLAGTFEGMWEMSAQKIKSVWWFAVNQQSCGPECTTEIAHMYSYSNGRLVLHTNANLAGYQDLWPELFINFDKLSNKQKKAAQRVWEEHNYEVLYRLSKDGRSVTMYIEELPFLDEHIPETVFTRVTYQLWR